MGKVCKSLKAAKSSIKNRRVKSPYTRYLDPIVVLEHGEGKATAPESCTDLGKKIAVVLGFKDIEDQIMLERRVNDELPVLSSPARVSNAVPLENDLDKTPKTPIREGSFHCSTSVQTNNVMSTPKTPCTPGRLSSTPSILANLVKTPKTPYSKSRFQTPSARNNLLKTPKTPCTQETLCESRLESLPIDILAKVLCHLHHDQLRPAFHVSKRVREAVLLARDFHFNFTTPDRSRQALLNTTTPQPWEHWPFVKNKNSMLKPCPKTPKAPRHVSRPPPKFELEGVCPINDALFQESAFPSRCPTSSSLPKPISKSQLASNRVLFYSDELNCCNFLL